MDSISPLNFSMDGAPVSFGMENKCDSDVCMSDRLVPLRGTCGSIGQMKMERDENWAPKNEYHEALSHNVLGKESLANVKILSYKHKPQCQQPAHNDLQVLYSSNRDGAPKQKPSRVIPQNAMRVLDAPGLQDDFYAHPVGWSAQNLIAVALFRDVFLFDTTS